MPAFLHDSSPAAVSFRSDSKCISSPSLYVDSRYFKDKCNLASGWRIRSFSCPYPMIIPKKSTTCIQAPDYIATRLSYHHFQRYHCFARSLSFLILIWYLVMSISLLDLESNENIILKEKICGHISPVVLASSQPTSWPSDSEFKHQQQQLCRVNTDLLKQFFLFNHGICNKCYLCNDRQICSF